MKYNLHNIMANAWKLFKMAKNWVNQLSFAECLRRAWATAKDEVKAAEEAAAKGIRRMHYSEYKSSYSDCQTVEGSYDKRTKTIEVMTKVVKCARRSVSSLINGLCPRCHTYCYGDCTASGRW